jgi:glycosyltransferase involved in cell wall biosynthesis
MLEVIEGIEVIRVAHFPSHDASGVRRFLNYFSFAVSSSLIGWILVKRPNVLYVSQGPATLMLPAIVLKCFFRCPIVLDVQDLWPESVVSSGMMHIPGGVFFLHLWCNFTYWVSDRIIALSFGYKRLIMNRGVGERKVRVIYNWCDEASIAIRERDECIGQHHGLLDRFNVMFAGTMGKVQSLKEVLEAAEIINHTHPNIQLVFVGGGIELPHLKEIASHRKLSNVRFIDRQPISEISKIMAYADVMIIHLRRDLLGGIGIPQKTQAYLAAGKPIIVAIDGETAEIVKKARAGITCVPQDSQSIAAAILQMAALPHAELCCLGENGRRFYIEHMSFQNGVKAVLEELHIATGSHGQ